MKVEQKVDVELEKNADSKWKWWDSLDEKEITRLKVLTTKLTEVMAQRNKKEVDTIDVK